MPRKKKQLLTGIDRIVVGNLLWAVGLILTSKPYANDHEWLMRQHRSLIKALRLYMRPQARPRGQQFSKVELENMLVLINDAMKGVASVRAKNAARKLRSQLMTLHSRYES